VFAAVLGWSAASPLTILIPAPVPSEREIMRLVYTWRLRRLLSAPLTGQAVKPVSIGLVLSIQLFSMPRGFQRQETLQNIERHSPKHRAPPKSIERPTPSKPFRQASFYPFSFFNFPRGFQPQQTLEYLAPLSIISGGQSGRTFVDEPRFIHSAFSTCPRGFQPQQTLDY
jgi:hypothetical protein